MRGVVVTVVGLLALAGCSPKEAVRAPVPTTEKPSESAPISVVDPEHPTGTGIVDGEPSDDIETAEEGMDAPLEAEWIVEPGLVVRPVFKLEPDADNGASLTIDFAIEGRTIKAGRSSYLSITCIDPPNGSVSVVVQSSDRHRFMSEDGVVATYLSGRVALSLRGPWEMRRTMARRGGSQSYPQFPNPSNDAAWRDINLFMLNLGGDEIKIGNLPRLPYADPENAAGAFADKCQGG